MSATSEPVLTAATMKTLPRLEIEDLDEDLDGVGEVPDGGVRRGHARVLLDAPPLGDGVPHRGHA